MTAKKKVGRVDIDFSSLNKKAKAKKPAAWNPWPRCHPDCETCMDASENYDQDVEELQEIEDEIGDQVAHMAELRKSIAQYTIRMRKHVQTEEHKKNIRRNE